MKGLIVTADDFGVATEVNEAVEEAYRNGILTAASLMVGGAAATDAVARAHRQPGLKIGLHLVLVEGQPVLPAADIPDLVAPDGSFRTDMVQAGVDIFFRPKVRRQLAAEIAAQFAKFRQTGLSLDHVNAHKHFHLHPTITSLIIDVGQNFGMTAARIPKEPHAVLKRVEPDGRNQMPLLAPWLALQRRKFAKASLLTPDQVFGLAWSGAMTRSRLAGILDHLPSGLTEIYLHPATSDAFSGAAPGYRYAAEFAALTDPVVLDAARRSGARRGGFGDFYSQAARP